MKPSHRKRLVYDRVLHKLRQAGTCHDERDKAWDRMPAVGREWPHVSWDQPQEVLGVFSATAKGPRTT